MLLVILYVALLISSGCCLKRSNLSRSPFGMLASFPHLSTSVNMKWSERTWNFLFDRGQLFESHCLKSVTVWTSWSETHVRFTERWCHSSEKVKDWYSNSMTSILKISCNSFLNEEYQKCRQQPSDWGCFEEPESGQSVCVQPFSRITKFEFSDIDTWSAAKIGSFSLGNLSPRCTSNGF